MPRCDQCRFFHPHPAAPKPGGIRVSGDGVYGGGECRFKPPVRKEGELIAGFPIVAIDCWCGRFEPARHTSHA